MKIAQLENGQYIIIKDSDIDSKEISGAFDKRGTFWTSNDYGKYIRSWCVMNTLWRARRRLKKLSTTKIVKIIE